MIDKIACIFELLFRPIFLLLDRSGLAGDLRFSPLYKTAAAITLVIILSYVLALIMKNGSGNSSKSNPLVYIGRLLIILIAMSMVYNIFNNTGFIIGRGRQTSPIVGSDIGFILILALIIYLEIRLYRKFK